MDEQLLRRICAGNGEAMEFLAHFWSPYVHQIDDIIDGERKSPREVLATFALAAQLFAHPFYLKNLAALKQLVLTVTVLYADSVEFERSAVGWQREWADHNRHAGMEMVVAVAMICGGYEHGAAISREQRVICWQEHHDREGKAV